jgi:hypothetical protein
VELGEASIIFTDAETEETVAVKEGDTTVDLISGSKYSVEIDSEALTIDVTEVDLSETIPEKITINVSAAVSLLADENTHIFDATTLTAATDKEVVADGTTFDTKTTTDNK